MRTGIHFIIIAFLLQGICSAVSLRRSDASWKFKEQGIVYAQQFPASERAQYMADELPREDNVNDKKEFWAENMTDPDNGVWEKISATCRKKGTYCYVYTEDSITHDANFNNIIESVFNEYETKIHNTIVAEFGMFYPGINNDSRMTVFILDIKDGWDGNTVTGYYAGYFHPLDQYPSSVDEHSNERNMLYIDYNPLITNNYAADPKTVYGTIAHELQHLIHYQADPMEKSWLDEGCSGYAEYLCYNPPSDHISAYLNSEQTSLTQWNGELADYGASFLFIAWLKEKYGKNQMYFLYDLVHDPAISFDSVKNRLPYGVDADEALVYYLAANYQGTKHDLDKDWMLCYENLDINRYKDIEFFKQYSDSNQYHTGDLITDSVLMDSAKNTCPMYQDYYYTYPVAKKDITIIDESARYILFRQPFWPDSTFYFSTASTRIKLYALGYDKDNQLVYRSFIPVTDEGKATLVLERTDVTKMTVIATNIGLKDTNGTTVTASYGVAHDSLKLSAFSNPILRNQVIVALDTDLSVVKSVMEYDNTTSEISLTKIRDMVYSSSFFTDDAGRYKVRVNVQDAAGLSQSAVFYFNVQDINFFPSSAPAQYYAVNATGSGGKMFLFEDPYYYGFEKQSRCGLRIESAENFSASVNLNVGGFFGYDEYENLRLYKKTKEKWKYCESEISGQELAGRIDGAGIYAVFADHTPPEVLYDSDDTIYIKDDFSGISSVQIDGDVQYSVKHVDDVVYITVSGEGKGNIYAVDRAGNSKELAVSFAAQSSSAYSAAVPNPASDIVQIRVKNMAAHQIMLTISDSSADSVYESSDFYTENLDAVFEWDAAGQDAASGVYWYEIEENGNAICNGKITILR